jgi:hypothetical protein
LVRRVCLVVAGPCWAHWMVPPDLAPTGEVPPVTVISTCWPQADELETRMAS